jgi:hypothetical protein
VGYSRGLRCFNYVHKLYGGFPHVSGVYSGAAIEQSVYDRLRAGQPRGRNSSPGRVKNFLFSTSSKTVLGSNQPHNQWVPGVLSPGVRGQGREADHSPPASVKVKKV